VAVSPDDGLLARECDVFSRYLTGTPATPLLQRRYAAGHEALILAKPSDRLLDRALLAVARSTPAATATADTFAAVFRRRSLLRCKLILLLAIVENDPGHHSRYDTGVVDERAAALVKLVGTGVWWGGRMLVSLVLFTPIALASAFTGRAPRGG
jgi:hypothetical protein